MPLDIIGKKINMLNKVWIVRDIKNSNCTLELDNSKKNPNRTLITVRKKDVISLAS